MSSFLIKSFSSTLNKPVTRLAHHATSSGQQQLFLLRSSSTFFSSFPTTTTTTTPAAIISSVQQQQLRNYYYESSSSSSSRAATTTREDERIWPVYMHHVSKIVLQHLQDSRSNWLIEQGLDNGLHIKSNGTFLLKFPARKGYDAGKIWTSYDASTRQHWLLVYRNKFNARFLLKKGQRCPTGRDKMLQDNNNNNAHKINANVEEQIRQAVDQMIRLVPPRIDTTNTSKQL